MVRLWNYVRSLSLVHVNGDSMAPTFRDGDLLLVSRTQDAVPDRGDLVVLKLQEADDMTHVKRVVGLPGDTIAFDDGSLFVNDGAISELYLGGLPQTLGLESRRWMVANDECFVLGDNRAHSTDSREYGPVPLSTIRGVAKLRIWPIVRRRTRR